MSEKLRALVFGSGFASQEHTEALRYCGVEVVGMASRTGLRSDVLQVIRQGESRVLIEDVRFLDNLLIVLVQVDQRGVLLQVFLDGDGLEGEPRLTFARGPFDLQLAYVSAEPAR